MTPSEIVPGFAEDRLVVVAKKVVGVHNLARTIHQPKNGDTSYGFGCVRYDRLVSCCHVLSRSEEAPWFEADGGRGRALRIAIGGTEIIPFHGDPDCPGYRTRRRGRRQGHPRGQTFLIEPHGDWFWVMALDTDNKRRIHRVVVEEVHPNGGTPRNSWTVPVDTHYCLPDLHKEEQQPSRISAQPQAAPTPSFGPKSGVRPSDVHEEDGR